MGSLTIQFDTAIPAVYVYLRDPQGFKSHKSKEVGKGVIVDLDSVGNLIGVELLGPGSLKIVLEKVVAQFRAPALKQLESKRRVIEELLAAT